MNAISINIENQTAEATTSTPIPIYVYATVIASLSIVVGVIWDISWHKTIGRDGLLSAPHLAIYFGGVVAGFFSGYQALKTSFFSSDEVKKKHLKFWGVFYATLGQMFCVWGAFAMITSAPFDDWWHNTYGLDVKILSPPHSILAAGILMIELGAVISVLSFLNQTRLKGQADEQTYKRLSWLFALPTSLVLISIHTISSQFLGTHDMHGVLFYQVACLLFTLLLVSFSTASLTKWGATKAAGLYTIIMAMTVWILPLFAAEPLLGPVLHHVDRFQPFEFPLLLIVPALFIDIIKHNYSHINVWLRSVYYAVAFLIPLLIVQWPFGNFLFSEYGRGWFFGQYSWYFGANPNWEFRYAYADWMVTSGMELVIGILIALAIAFVSARLGIKWGVWMKSIYR